MVFFQLGLDTDLSFILGNMSLPFVCCDSGSDYKARVSLETFIKFEGRLEETILCA